MKRIRILAGAVVIGLTTVFSGVVTAADQQEGQMVGHTSKAQGAGPSTPTAPQSGASPQSNDELLNNKPAAVPPSPLYKPPLGLGSPTGLVAGGSRGTNVCLSDHSWDSNTTLTLSVLTPTDHIGLTIHEHPSLYWYLSAETNCRIELTLTDEQAVEPLLELTLSPPIKPGVQRVRLADHNVHLAPGVKYQWAVALVPDPEHRSKDIIAAGEIKRIEATEVLQTKLAQANKTEVAAVYAEAGLWYDAMTTISALIADVPQNPVLRMQRAALLEQVQLPEVADYDRKLSADQGS